MASVLFIDNFDSFTYNLVEEFRILQFDVVVMRNNVDYDILLEQARERDLVVMSPGPGAPKDAGHCLRLANELSGEVPVLGICLGHQTIAEAAGSKTVRANRPMHGKASLLQHSNQFCFNQLPNPLMIARYHSLVIEGLPKKFISLAQVDEIEMAIYSAEKKQLGFQFHPESILTTNGTSLIKNSVELLLSNNKGSEG